MRLSEQQLRDFDRDGFLIFPSLLTSAEVEILRDEVARLREIDSDLVRRERNGAVRTIWRLHEDNGVTQSAAFRALSRTPRMLETAQQLLSDPKLYIYQSKINVKPAIEGTIWSWHQDYGPWQRDGVPRDQMLNTMVMLDDADEMGGALYILPGSHKCGPLEHVEDTAVGALNQYSVRRDLLVEALNVGKATPMVGAAGTVVMFHCNVVHGSGHNMSSRDRRQVYVVYNPVANAPAASARIRGDHFSSGNQSSVELGAEDGVLASARQMA